jgi:hypothetical protein
MGWRRVTIQQRFSAGERAARELLSLSVLAEPDSDIDVAMAAERLMEDRDLAVSVLRVLVQALANTFEGVEDLRRHLLAIDLNTDLQL